MAKYIKLDEEYSKGDIIKSYQSKIRYKIIKYYESNFWNMLFNKNKIGMYKVKKAE
jgi:hypothetical protein